MVLTVAGYFVLPAIRGRGDRPSDNGSPPPASVQAPATQGTPAGTDQPPLAPRSDVGDQAAAAILTEAAIRDFASKMVEAAASGDAQRVLPFYADRVDYFAMGPVGQDVIRSDKEACYRRWPEVKLQLTGNIDIENGPVPDSRRVKYTTAYEVANASRGVKATGTSMTSLVVAVMDGTLKIVDQKEMIRTSRQ